jgi:dipeptidyl aminopeptidase/acylaminoacyl peptidase
MSGENDLGVTGWSRWLETGQAGMSRAYWSDPERYRRASAFERAADISAPVLLFHGEMDSPSGQAEQMYAALRRLRRPAALTYLFGEDHSIHTPGNARVYYAQILDWFDRHLRSGAPQSASASAGAMPPSGRD